MSNDNSVIPMLEPLSKATGSLIKPLYLNSTDFLKVELDNKGTNFICSPLCLREKEEGDEKKSVIRHNGKQYVHHSAFASGTARGDWFKRLPEHKVLPTGEIVCATTDFSAIVLYHSWSMDRLILSGEAKLMLLSLVHRFFAQSKSNLVTANYRINNVVPDLPQDYVDHPVRPLLPQQRVGLVASLQQKAYALFMAQGTCKTGIVIARVNLEGKRKRIRDKRMYRVLIVCPNQVRTNWANEFESFSTTPGKVTILRGGEIGRARNLVDSIRDEEDCAWSATICSYDSQSSMEQYLKRVEWDLVVWDESHYAKSGSAKRTKAAHKIRSMPLVKQCMILTGTPVANSYRDLWSQFEMLGEGMSGFLNYKNFKKFYGIFKNQELTNGTSVERLVGLKNLPLLQERLARVSFILSKAEARMNLPDKSYDLYEVSMTLEQATIYRKIANELRIQIGDIDDNKTITADHILTMLLRLAQITSGHLRFDKKVDPVTFEKLGGGVVEQIPGKNPKVEAVMEMLTDPGRDDKGKTIIWCCFREDIRVLRERLAKEGINHRVYFGGVNEKDREEAVLAFNSDPTCRVFIANPATAGEGINLVGYDWWNAQPEQKTYTDHEIFFSQDWSATKRSQAEDRAHRKGTRQPVRITDLCIPGTIDEEIRARVIQKQEAAMMIQDVKSILQRVLDVNGISSGEDD